MLAAPRAAAVRPAASAASRAMTSTAPGWSASQGRSVTRPEREARVTVWPRSTSAAVVARPTPPAPSTRWWDMVVSFELSVSTAHASKMARFREEIKSTAHIPSRRVAGSSHGNPHHAPRPSSASAPATGPSWRHRSSRWRASTSPPRARRHSACGPIARDLGMVSSGIYRYVESRDELLTRLIVDSYTSLTHAVRAAHDAVPRRDLAGRWDAVGHGLRGWATRAPPRLRPALRLSRARLRGPRRAHREPGTAVLALLVEPPRRRAPRRCPR